VSGWATALSKGPANESGQSLTAFNVTSDNQALFAVQPSIDAATGTLTYTPAANANGSATVTVTLKDSGETANGGADTSAAQMFTIAITAVNDAPSFTKGADQSVLEDSAAQTVTGWASGISKGPSNESAQTLSEFAVTNDNHDLFSEQPAVDAATGTLTYTPAANQYGSATLTVTLSDDGVTANGGTDTSAAQTFTITVTAVNDAPSFTKGADQSVLEDSAAQTVSGWATGIIKGPNNESDQTLVFTVTNDNNGLFSSQPAVDAATGTLAYTPLADANGTATVTVTLADSGGTENGGVDTSADQTFTITVTAVNDAPSFTKGGDQNVLEDSGAQTASGWATAISKGANNEGLQNLTFVVSDVTNSALFASGGTPAVSADGTLRYTPAVDANGSSDVTIYLYDVGDTESGGANQSASMLHDHSDGR
jgi:hypothetical protein